jgi:hypothetical protein
MQELCNLIRILNLRIKGIQEGEETQTLLFNKIIAEKFPSLEKELPIQIQEASRIQNRHDQNRLSPQHIVVKTISTDKKERML